MTEFQSPNGSTVLVGQSVKSGSGTSKPTTLCGEPLPSDPWQVAQLFLKMYSPPALGGSALASDVGGVVASCAAWSEMTPATPAYTIAATSIEASPRGVIYFLTGTKTYCSRRASSVLSTYLPISR